MAKPKVPCGVEGCKAETFRVVNLAVFSAMGNIRKKVRLCKPHFEVVVGGRRFGNFSMSWDPKK